VEVRLLGTLEVLDDTGGTVPVSGAKLRSLLAALALRPGQAVSAELLVEELWGEEAKATAANSLQGLVSKLRRALPADVVLTRVPGYVLDIGAEATDIGRFERLATDGRKALAAGDTAAAATTLRKALQLWRGPTLAEFVYEEFAQGVIVRLGEERASVLEDRIDADLACGRHAELVAELEAAVADAPLRERLRGQLMLALYGSGRQADALRQFQEARSVLGEELGLEPGPELRRLEAAMLAQDADLDPPAPAAPAPRLTGNLPATLSAFVGRREELVSVREQVRAARLITLTGPGGAGKTRLALEVATAAAVEFMHGAWLVELAGVSDPAGVVPAAAAAVGVRQVPGPPPGDGSGSAVDAIAAHLAGRSLLIVLDNCEHVIEQAAAVSEALLQQVPGLRILATSREPLGVAGEAVVTVGPMLLDDGVLLFVQRARAARPAIELDAAGSGMAEGLVHRLDAMPLAIELAAARLRGLPLEEIAARLDDRFQILTSGPRTAPARHQTLRAVVDWSYDLLFSDEQRLFARLAPFVGTFSLGAAEAICADEVLAASDVFDVLMRLVDKSLVIAHAEAGPDARYSQLQTLREYGWGRLQESGERDVTRARHARYYRRLAEGAREGLRGATGPACRARLSEELGNLRAALDWHIGRPDAEGAMSLASGMAWLWFLNNDFREGARWMQDALATAGSAPGEVREVARAWHGYFVATSSSPAAGAVVCEAAAKGLSTSADLVSRAEALLLFGVVLAHARRFTQSLEVLAEAGEVLEQTGHEWLVGVHDVLAAFTLAELGRLDEAEAAARSGLAHLDATGEVQFSVDALSMLADIAEIRGDLHGASAQYEALLTRCRAADMGYYESVGLMRLAKVRARQGDDEAADDLYARALPMRAIPWLSAEATVGHAAVARRRGDFDRARELLQTARTEFEVLGVDSGEVLVLAGLAWWALAAGELDEATEFASAATQRVADADPTLQLIAETASAAVKVTTEPTLDNRAAFLELTRRRAGTGAVRGSLIDEPDVSAMATRISTSP